MLTDTNSLTAHFNTQTHTHAQTHTQQNDLIQKKRLSELFLPPIIVRKLSGRLYRSMTDPTTAALLWGTGTCRPLPAPTGGVGMGAQVGSVDAGLTVETGHFHGELTDFLLAASGA